MSSTSSGGPGMDVEDYRRQYESTLTAAARPLGPDDREAALATARDKAADLQSRLDAVASVSNWAASQEDALDALLAILRDSSEPAELRSATITGLEMNRFRAIKFQPKMADYTQALHEVVHEAPDEELLDQSLEALASQQDPEIQNRLVQGLADPSVAITSPQRSVELLAYDPKPDYQTVLQGVVQDPPDEATKQEALRLLAVDSSSQDVIAGVLEDKNESVATRQVSAAALQTAAPERYRAVAERLVADDDEDEELRTTLAAGLDAQAGSAAEGE